MSMKLFSTDPPPAILPTEAEVRAFDLENQETVAQSDDEERTLTQGRQDESLREAYERYPERGIAPGGDFEDGSKRNVRSTRSLVSRLAARLRELRP